MLSQLIVFIAGNSKEALSKKRVLLMEEVDGMAGNFYSTKFFILHK